MPEMRACRYSAATRAALSMAVLIACAGACVGQWQVGVGSRSILPLVGGRSDYFAPLPPTDCCSAGTFVKRFDNGQIAVGNGASEAHWVRDDIRVRVAAIGPDPKGKTAVFVASEVYMLFLNDLQQYYDAVRERIGRARYDDLHFFVHAHHNHEGPDTSGLSARPINHDYYAHMVQQMVDATVDALDSRQPATLRHSSDVFYYGLGDIRDPRLQNARLQVLRAYATQNDTVADAPFLSMVQWGMHPEVTLGFRPDVPPSECEQLPLRPDTDCAKDSVFTHDYPGHFSQTLVDLYGGQGEALYFNGAIGCQIGNHGPVWEVDKDHPLGNGGTVPEGASIVPENYRRAYLIGSQLANFVYGIDDSAATVPYGALDYRVTEAMVRVTNFLFRVGLVPSTAINPFGDPTRPLRIGDTLREAYVCPTHKSPSTTVCVPDNFEYLYDSSTRLPFRVGQFMLSEVKYLGLGPIKFLTIPGELAPELSGGLPQNFDDPSSVSIYYQNPEYHTTGAAYTVPGAAMSMLGCDENNPCWTLGLTQDEIGYMFPISDWRVLCTAEPEECDELYQRGALNFTDSMAGSMCRFVVNFPAVARADYLAQFDERAWEVVNSTCTYGQATGKAKDHYEETNSASWDIADTYIEAVGRLLGQSPSGRFCANNYTCAGMAPSPASQPSAQGRLAQQRAQTPRDVRDGKRGHKGQRRPGRVGRRLLRASVLERFAEWVYGN